MRSNCPGIFHISKGPSTQKLPGLLGTPPPPPWLFIPFLGTTQSVPLVQPPMVFNTLRSSWNPETVGGEQSRGCHSSRSRRVGEEAFLHSQACGVGEGLWTLQEGSSLQPPVKIRESRAPTGTIRSLPLGPHHQRKAILKGTYNSWSMAKLP